VSGNRDADGVVDSANAGRRWMRRPVEQNATRAQHAAGMYKPP
jgi:hypothetical protein